MKTIGLIIEDSFDISDNGRGLGPRLGCIDCKEDVRTEVNVSPALYRRYGIDGPIHTLACPLHMDDITPAFAL